MKAHRIVWIFVGLHLLLAITYAWITPYRQGGILVHQRRAYAADIGAPDERQHVNYIGHLASGVGFPVFDPKDPNLYESYQSHQPPLFYLIATPLAKIKDPTASSAVGLEIRFLNTVIGALGVLGIYFFVLWGFRSQSAALAAAAFAALLPMNLALSGAVSNDPLLFCLCTWTLAWAARGLQDGWTVWRALLTGLFMGLAFLTKTTSIALWPAVALGLYLARNAPTPQRPNARIVGAVLVLPLVLAAPWWLRNMSLYGDPFAMKAFTEAFQGSPQASVFIQAGGPLDYWVTGSLTGTGVLWWTLRSFFGVFGYMDIFLPMGIYVALSFVLLALILVRFRRHPDSSDQSENSRLLSSKSVSLMAGVYFVLVLALFLRFNAQYFQGQARYIFPAIAPIAATLGLGAVALMGRKPQWAAWSIAGILLALNLYVLTLLPNEFQLRLAPPLSQAVNAGETS